MSESLGDSTMLEIFRAEVETHAETLSANLLALEKGESPKRIEEMMRAAHSIKGAARIVGVKPAAELAHVMEDSFVAAQEGRIRMSSEAVDSLLAGVDLLNQIAMRTRDAPDTWQTEFDDRLPQLLAAIAAISNPDVAAAPTSPAAPTRDHVVEPAPDSSLVATPLAAMESTRVDDRSRLTMCRAGQESSFQFAANLDDETAESARVSLLKEIQAGQSRIVLDLSSAVDVSAHGLSLLAALAQESIRRAPPLQLVVRGSEQVRLLLLATGLSARFELLEPRMP